VAADLYLLTAQETERIVSPHPATAASLMTAIKGLRHILVQWADIEKKKSI
jgi:hypothetical protein